MTTTFRTVLIALLLAGLLSAGTVPAGATSVRHQNIVDLISLSELILVGEVVSLTDGFENGLPYTEITLALEETIKGNARGTYIFRQYGLLAPKRAPNGLTCVTVTPDGWPRFQTGEKVFLFLYQRASKSGLRTTVGLLQGKFTMEDGRLRNGLENVDLFKQAEVNPGLLSSDEEKMLKMGRGAVRADVFVSFVRKAVEGRWVEGRKLQHVR